jgi:hypothetical protein
LYRALHIRLSSCSYATTLTHRRAPRRGTRPRVALTLSSLADCKRERLAWRSLRTRCRSAARECCFSTKRAVSGASLDASLTTGFDEYDRSGADSPFSCEDIVVRLRVLGDVREGVGGEAELIEGRHGRWGSGSWGRGCRRGRLWPCQSCAGATEQSRGVLLRVTRQGNAGTKRVRQLGHERVRASTPKVVKQPDFRQEHPRECPSVDARPLRVFPS